MYLVGATPTGLNYTCTTGGGNTANGASLPVYQKPTPDSSPFNGFAYTGIQSTPAPFALATCYRPLKPNDVNVFRSYQVYCNRDAIPAEWRALFPSPTAGPVLL